MRVAIIPARGGSKRIPRKNIKLFCGQPMLAYPIKAALNSGVVDKVVVSTDDTEIAAIARQYGAETPFMRKAKLADDFTGTTDVIRNAIKELQQLGWPLSSCACIYATTPLLDSERIAAAYRMLLSSKADYVFSAARFSFPIQRALLQNAEGVVPFDPASIMQRSQDLAETFHDAGQLYWATADTWLDTAKAVFGTGSRMLLLPAHLVQDIDTAEDWRRAELLYQLLQAPAQ
ncbi:N-acylneuraminate cytidylyltransferase [Arsukibacterium tuosuense]|uniref:N-acylneuraminate cytidylyltransferase n=1 Tax=Arsukibacterium tuosuense TaxID=1323745 RepID=A0A285J866_9GAMM|nr:pseudaminic acid cytidylyltransferase [Arsukibacterium tuosuense]SNY56047.1 N-acylneuraminate cytidylyltransferase [Arsukibacterium tuosuense]